MFFKKNKEKLLAVFKVKIAKLGELILINDGTINKRQRENKYINSLENTLAL